MQKFVSAISELFPVLIFVNTTLIAAIQTLNKIFTNFIHEAIMSPHATYICAVFLLVYFLQYHIAKIAPFENEFHMPRQKYACKLIQKRSKNSTAKTIRKIHITHRYILLLSKNNKTNINRKNGKNISRKQQNKSKYK